jgi:aminoglycoside 6'-N-acetyltransferase I
MQFITMNDATGSHIDQCAAILVDALRHFPTAWKDQQSARIETESFRASDRLAFLAIEKEAILGWIGAIRHTRLMWELHPLVVHPDHQGKGVGKALVRKLENEALRYGVLTIWLGTDDDFGGTNIYGEDLYPNVLDRLSQLQPVTGHPYTFYQKMGYAVVGVIPDAGGIGKPDILMAKRIS